MSGDKVPNLNGIRKTNNQNYQKLESSGGILKWIKKNSIRQCLISMIS